ncbi:hypothetical protein GCM10027596_18290 [Nocardioides korecus]
MNSGASFAIGTGSLVLVAVLSLLCVTAVVTSVRLAGRRRGWSPGATASRTWAGATAAVAVLCLVLIRVLPSPLPRQGWTGSVSQVGSGPDWTMTWPDAGSRTTDTLVWLPCVLALLWAVLHTLRGGAGRTRPLLDVAPPVAVAALWLVSLPLQITVFTVGLLGTLTWVGLALWLVGEALVATGRTTVGDVGVWAGIALVAADAWPGYVGLVSPVVVALLAVRSARRGRTPAVS